MQTLGLGGGFLVSTLQSLRVQGVVLHKPFPPSHTSTTWLAITAATSTTSSRQQ